MSTIFTEEGLAIRTRPLDGCEQEAVSPAECKELLLCAGAKTLLANYLATITFNQSRGNNFSSAGSASVDHSDNRSGKKIYFGIRIECLESLSFTSDSLSNNTVFDEEVCD